MSEQFDYGESDKMEVRKMWLAEFLDRMFDTEDRPYFIADEATLYDIYTGNEEELSQRCKSWYGRELESNEFLLPIWQLLDSLHGR